MHGVIGVPFSVDRDVYMGSEKKGGDYRCCVNKRVKFLVLAVVLFLDAESDRGVWMH